jgi:hypothetical protein
MRPIEAMPPRNHHHHADQASCEQRTTPLLEIGEVAETGCSRKEHGDEAEKANKADCHTDIENRFSLWW